MTKIVVFIQNTVGK